MNLININDWKAFFPFSEIRKEQEKAINFILNSFSSGKKYVIAQLGTGCGKSATGITVSRFLNANSSLFRIGDLSGSYVLTTQKFCRNNT